jgi:4-amino-4-deoxy-L-arabinose transferase-like glycosyltransferase
MTRWTVAALAGVALLAGLYLAGVPRNPPGFHLDEASIAYNALHIARSGVDEHGERFPLFFQAFGEYKNPVYIYVLAAVYLVTGPSVPAARILSALMGVAAALLLGRLAWVQTRDHAVTIVTVASAALTPGLFEISRLAFEVAAFPLALALFLLAARRAFDERPQVLALAATLALVTYTYTAGRLLGPALALLLVLIFRRRALLAVWLLYALTFVPLFIWNAKSGGALTTREGVVDERSVAAVTRNYVANLSPVGLLWRGDPNARHHVPGSGGPVLLVTLVLALVSLLRRDRWIGFLGGGALASMVPVALTVDVGHALRLSGLFVFLVVLSIPALDSALRSRVRAAIVLAAIVLQAGFFFYTFHTRGASRLNEFHGGVQETVFSALDQRPRPVYLPEGPGATFGYWFGELRGVDRRAFALLKPGELPPPGAIFIGQGAPQPGAVLLSAHGPFGVHRVAE